MIRYSCCRRSWRLLLAAFATPGPLRHVGDVLHYTLMNDYSADWPFWADDGLCDVGEPALPASLAARALTWAAVFNTRYSHMTGWPDAATAQQQEVEAHHLYDLVKSALPNDAVTLHYWEVDYPGKATGT